MRFYPWASAQIESDEIYLLKPLDVAGHNLADASQPEKPTSWRSGVTISVFALGFHVVLGFSLCVLAVMLGHDHQRWFSLRGFGPPMSLLTARYLNFGLDLCARVLSLTLEALLATVGLRTTTALWSSSQGVRVSDALAFNFIQLEVSSIWTAFRTQVPRKTKISYILSITCGLIVYLSGSIMFGYENLTVNRAGNRDISVGNNQMILGSNASGSYIAPDYSSLVLSNGSVSPFTSTVLDTLMQIDLSHSNESISSFDLASESASSLLLRNITAVLIKQTVSTQLADCQPVLEPATIPFGLYSSGSLITQIWQDLPSTTTAGIVNRYSEDLAARMLYFGASKFQPYTFIMTLAENTTSAPTPADDSQILIVLASRRNCLSDPFETAFGPMPQANTIAPILNMVNETFSITHTTLACRNVRTTTRTIYAPDGTVVERTSESFYARPVLSTANRLYTYTSIDFGYPPVAQSLGIAPYGGIGSLLNSDLVYSSSWQFPNCGVSGTNPITPANSTELEAVSAAWSKAVERVQHYETTILQAFVKQDTTVVSTPVMIAVPVYRLAVIPGALLVYGLSMIVAICVLMALLLGTGDKRGNPLHAKSLSVWRIANELAVIREGEGSGAPVEASEKSLKRDLGGVRVRRRPRRDM